jgi:DNA-directed RNA polymerase specialized sigma24 family protein
MEKQNIYKNELELLIKLSKGDENAYTYIFNQYHEDVLKLAQKFARTRQQAEDLSLGVFAKIWVNRQELPGVTSLTDYIFVTAHDYIVSEMGKK